MTTILIISSQQGVEDYWPHVRRLGDIYNECFEDGDEKEPFYSVILERVQDTNLKPRTELHICEDEEGNVLGGAIYDIYQSSLNDKTVHLIYLMVAKEHRRKGVGTSLLVWSKTEFEFCPIFIEIDKENKDALEFYKANRAYPVLEDGYVQPPLVAGGDWCDNLMLYALNREPDFWEAYKMLIHLYYGLDVLGTPMGDYRLEQMREKMQLFYTIKKHFLIF